MLSTPPPGTPLYRVTAADRGWPDVLSGAGSYFSAGGRYNRIHQRTVYTAEDPLVSVCEYAYHQAVTLQRLLGCGPLSGVPIMSPPVRLVTEHTLWCFRLEEVPALVDLEDPAATLAYGHRAYELLNPTAADYHRTAMIADLIRQPSAGRPRVGGLTAPSVRTPGLAGYTPRQHVLFVPHDATSVAGKMIRRWTLTLEFADVSGRSVTPRTREIDWSRPWFRLGGARVAVPGYGGRPGARPLAAGEWHQAEVRFV